MQNELFPGKGILHGGDYNPEQWLDRPDILAEDIRLMKEAGINVATLGVFSWSCYEPVEGEFHLEWLEEIIQNLYENGIYTVLATPSGARPAWLDERYPSAMRVAGNGVRNHHGLRHNHCMSSQDYRKKVEIIDRKLAERFGSNPAVLMWHISNELGGECYCEACQKRFQEYLSVKFHGNIDELNKAWWTTFWSHTFNRFDQIESPLSNGEGSIHGLNLEWKRFTTWNMTDFLKFEKKILNEYAPDKPVTANLMKLYNGLDYQELSKEIDVVSWDSYPMYGNDFESELDTELDNSFDHAVMRGLKRDQPFMLMESTPSLVNWHPYNKLKRPGMHALASLQAIACGSDTVMYFQWRKGRGSFEQYHGAVVDHLGRSDTRVFQEVASLGAVLKKLKPVAGSTIQADAAVLFDWNNRWAIADMAGLSKEKKQYEKTCRMQYASLTKLGVETDVVSPLEDLSRYALVTAPMLYLLKPGVAENLKKYVENGGHLIATYLTGYVDENTLCYLGGFPGDGLQELFGLYSEEIDTLYPKDQNRAVFQNGSHWDLHDFAEVLKVQDAECMAEYESDFYGGTPVVTKKAYGAGEAWYVGARMEQHGMEQIYRDCLQNAGIRRKLFPEGIEFHSRTGDGVVFDFYQNTTQNEQKISVEEGRNLLTGEPTAGNILLGGYETLIIERKQ